MVTPAGEPIVNSWLPYNTGLRLAVDAQGRLNAYYVTYDAADAARAWQIVQVQQTANGRWTEPVLISTGFLTPQHIVSVDLLAGQLCVDWDGQTESAAGPVLDGLFRNCAVAGDVWTVQADPVALTDGWALFAPARAPNGLLATVFISYVDNRRVLFFTEIDETLAPTTVLTGTQLSSKNDEIGVLAGSLVIDAAGIYHVVWAERREGFDLSIMSRRSLDGGQTWSPAEEIYAGFESGFYQFSFSLAADALGQVHLVFGGDNAIHYQRWTAAHSWDHVTEVAASRDDAAL